MSIAIIYGAKFLNVDRIIKVEDPVQKLCRQSPKDSTSGSDCLPDCEKEVGQAEGGLTAPSKCDIEHAV